MKKKYLITIGLKMMMNNIPNLLDKTIPSPWCELNFNTDYELLIAIMLSAQTTDKRVNQVTKVLFEKYKDLSSLSYADIVDVEDIIRPLGSFHKKSIYTVAIAKELLEKYDGVVPKERNTLEQLPGVGRKTVSVFLSEFYDYPEFAVDTHVDRVSKRLGIAKKNDNVLQIEQKLKKFFPKEEWARRHKQMVLFGRYYCKAVKPLCETCLLKKYCNYYK